MATVSLPVTLTANTAENVNDLNSNLNALVAAVNSIDDANIAATAGIQESKLANGATGLAKGAFRAYRNAAGSLANGALVVFDTDTGADVSNWYDTASGRYTPQVAGWYLLCWGVTGSAVASGVTWFADLRKNTVLDTHGMPGTQAASGASVASMGTAVVQANGTTDFFDVVLGHSSGVSQALFTGSPYTFFHGHLVGRS